jgi:hypothetical protein
VRRIAEHAPASAATRRLGGTALCVFLYNFFKKEKTQIEMHMCGEKKKKKKKKKKKTIQSPPKS